MNEWFTFLNYYRQRGRSENQILRIWECLDVIRGRNNPFDKGFTLEESEDAFEWHSGKEIDFTELQQLTAC